MKNLIVLSGAGISAESGIKTFRDSDGLWENHNVMDVATPEAWAKDPALVNEFYNQRRAQLAEVSPNAAHLFFAEMQEYFNTHIITQNVDDLHERAGSKQVLHLHGELTKVRSEQNENIIQEIGYQKIEIGDLAEDGHQLRPHIVWFGEAVPLIENAAQLCASADLMVVVGTSLQVYPAAGLTQYAPSGCPLYLIDPNADTGTRLSNCQLIPEKASKGVKTLKQLILPK